MQSFDVRCLEGHVEPSWMLHFGEAGTSMAYVPSLLSVRCSLRSCVNHSGPFWWDGVQSCSQQQKENEEFQRSGRLLINFIIWEQMLTVVYSGGLQGLWSVSFFQLLLPYLARVWLQPAGLHTGFWKSMKKTWDQGFFIRKQFMLLTSHWLTNFPTDSVEQLNNKGKESESRKEEKQFCSML